MRRIALVLMLVGVCLTTYGAVDYAGRHRARGCGMRRIALVLMLVGVCLTTYGAVDYFGDRQEVERQAQRTAQIQDDLAEELPAPVVESGMSAPVVGTVAPTARGVELGKALVTVRIPRFGEDWEWTAVEGVRVGDLARGPGHYPQTPLPGEQGNVAFAAHRAGHGNPFIDFDLLVPGDRVIFEQGGTRWTYRITTRPVIIEPDEVWVLDRFASGRWLTLTTCWPKYGSEKRMYVRGALMRR